MWLSRSITKPNKQSPTRLAYVSNSSNGKFNAVSYFEQQNVPVFSPYGINFLPCVGEQVLLLNLDGTDVCIGTIADNSNLNSGELMLKSSGGASIYLKNNGDVVINGLTITPAGQILNPT